MDKGSNISYTWTANGATYNLENPEIVFIYSGNYRSKITETICILFASHSRYQN